MSNSLDTIMERASAALAAMDYLTCEALCLEALAAARRQKNWADYGRILLPLQESRRQRRMIAAEGTVRLGSTGLDADPAVLLKQMSCGCILLTHPHRPGDAAALRLAAVTRRLHVEILYADNPAGAGQWNLRSFAGPELTCTIAAPQRDWIDRWIAPPGTAADYFIDATEALGDAALRYVDQHAPPSDPGQRLHMLEESLAVVTDHELLHQGLGAAAKALRSTRP